MKLMHVRNLVLMGCTLLATAAYGTSYSIDRQAGPNGFQIEGKVIAIDHLLGQLTVGNQLVQTTERTRYERGGFDDIAVGAQLYVEGTKAGNGKELNLMATKISSH